MSYSVWQPGTVITSPVYLDSGIVIAALVRGQARYAKAAQLLADLLMAQAHIVISLLTLSESLWGLAKLSYCDLFRQRYSQHFSPDLYRRWCDQIFEKYGERMETVNTMFRSWSQAGIPVELVPTTGPEFDQVCSGAIRYMREHHLPSADAAHLASAEAQARSFVTTDSHFQQVILPSLDIIHVT